MKYLLLLLCVSCVSQQPRYVMETKTTSYQCPQGTTYQSDGLCHYREERIVVDEYTEEPEETRVIVKRPVKKKAVVTPCCANNQCMSNSTFNN